MVRPDVDAIVATTDSADAVIVRGVSMRFDGIGEVLADIDLTVASGEFVSLIGPSGCGKSTLLRLVAGLETPTTGDITVNGKLPNRARADHDYAMAFQHAGLFEWRNVARNIELPLELAGWDPARRRLRSSELLDLMGLGEFASRMPWQLSGGMQQRVAIARTLAAKPSLLLMDEPFGALDELTRERLQDELVRIAAETKSSVLFVTHSIPEAVYLSDRVVVMTPRPGTVGAVIPIERNRDSSARSQFRDSGAFAEFVVEVRAALLAASD